MSLEFLFFFITFIMLQDFPKSNQIKISIENILFSFLLFIDITDFFLFVCLINVVKQLKFDGEHNQTNINEKKKIR